MDDKFSLKDFWKMYPTNDVCLEEIKKFRWPSGIACKLCKKVTKFYKVKGRTCYACEFCGYQAYPLASTIFEKSTTPLTLWFYTIYLMVQTRSSISVKQLQRILGVTYKTAWRMHKEIRLLLPDSLLTGFVVTDEAFLKSIDTELWV